MGKIVCEHEMGCYWPNCECTWKQSPVEQRKALPPGPNRPRYGASGELGAPAGMYAGTKHQKADPARLRALVEREYGLPPASARVIPIKAETPQLFDADIIEIMLREAGAVTEGFYIVIKKRETLEKFAETLNNLGS